MNVEIKVPPAILNSFSYSISEIYVQEGQHVELNDNLLDVETDSAILEVVSHSPGVIDTIHVSPGQAVSEGQIVITLRGIIEGELHKPNEVKDSSTSLESEMKDKHFEKPNFDEIIGNSPFNKVAFYCGVFGLVVGFILGSIFTAAWLG